MAIDGEGRAFLVGATFSPDLPTVPSLPGPDHDTGADAFAAVLSPGLDRLLGAVRIGAPGEQAFRTAAVTAEGRRLLAGGTTNGAGWPIREALDEDFSGSGDGVLALVAFPGTEAAPGESRPAPTR